MDTEELRPVHRALYELKNLMMSAADGGDNTMTALPNSIRNHRGRSMSELWAVTIHGQCDIYAFTTREKAQRYADLSEEFFKHLPQGGNYPSLSAEVDVWPYSAESHADCLRQHPEDELIASAERAVTAHRRPDSDPGPTPPDHRE